MIESYKKQRQTTYTDLPEKGMSEVAIMKHL